jgi:hypothetical protein
MTKLEELQKAIVELSTVATDLAAQNQALKAVCKRHVASCDAYEQHREIIPGEADEIYAEMRRLCCL